MGQVTSSRHLRRRDESSMEKRKWGLSRRYLENSPPLTGYQPGKTSKKINFTFKKKKKKKLLRIGAVADPSSKQIQNRTSTMFTLEIAKGPFLER